MPNILTDKSLDFRTLRELEGGGKNGENSQNFRYVE